ncbi:MAG: DUF4375 domain-containing protein [Burkholderiales bacterium]|jgi:hypothetical protein|nr:DUF4375 domain-containing protein [Burkholderiales bacterium]MBW8893035.1 DUF4375 domain-containing protein [Burkholderiales bacterium]
MGYWKLVEPIWDSVSIYDGGDIFLQQFAAAPEASQTLFAAHWTQSEVLNGGFGQYFFNSTGVLAPEAITAFRQLGMPKTAAAVERAVSFFGPPYPRDRGERQEELEAAADRFGEAFDPFQEANDVFFESVEEEAGGFEAAADAYAAANG